MGVTSLASSFITVDRSSKHVFMPMSFSLDDVCCCLTKGENRSTYFVYVLHRVPWTRST